MDKNKIKYITLDELKNIEPSFIKYMTFTDGSVAMVDSDKEDNEELNCELFNKDEKEPDIQNEPNMYLNFGEKKNYKTNTSSVNYNNINKRYTLGKNENNNFCRNQNNNYKRRNQKILNSNNQNYIRSKNTGINNQQNKASNKYSKTNYQNNEINYNNIFI